MSDLFPLKEYRGHEAKSLSLKASYPSAQVITVDSQFDGATADALASDYLAATSNVNNFAYTFTIDGVFNLSDLATAIPRFSLTYGSISNFIGRLVSLKTLDETNQTQITIRGAGDVTTLGGQMGGKK